MSDEPISTELELAASAPDADDDVHFAIAAKALGVSRKTIERMVKRDQLLRGPSGASATVSKRSLVSLLEDRRGGGVSRSDPAPIEQAIQRAGGASVIEPDKARVIEASGGTQELPRLALEPWIEEIVSARTRSAILEQEVERLLNRSARERARDQLLLELTAGNWRQRRRARRDALRRVILERDESDAES